MQPSLPHLILKNIENDYNAWKDLDIRASPCPDYPDCEVLEQEILILRYFINQLDIIKYFINCDSLRKEISDTLTPIVETYYEKCVPDCGTKRVLELLRQMDVIEYLNSCEVFVFIEEVGNDCKLITFKNGNHPDANQYERSIKHFHSFDCYYEFEDNIKDLINDKLKDFGEIEFVTSNDEQVIIKLFTEQETDDIKSEISTIDEI